MIQVGVGANFLDQRVAVHPRHHQVQNHHIRTVFLGQAQTIGKELTGKMVSLNGRVTQPTNNSNVGEAKVTAIESSHVPEDYNKEATSVKRAKAGHEKVL